MSELHNNPGAAGAPRERIVSLVERILERPPGAAPLELTAVTVRLEEQFRTMRGRTTVTVKLQLVVLPQVSLALVSTVVVPMGKVLPLGG